MRYNEAIVSKHHKNKNMNKNITKTKKHLHTKLPLPAELNRKTKHKLGNKSSQKLKPDQKITTPKTKQKNIESKVTDSKASILDNTVTTQKPILKADKSSLDIKTKQIPKAQKPKFKLFSGFKNFDTLRTRKIAVVSTLTLYCLLSIGLINSLSKDGNSNEVAPQIQKIAIPKTRFWQPKPQDLAARIPDVYLNFAQIDSQKVSYVGQIPVFTSVEKTETTDSELVLKYNYTSDFELDKDCKPLNFIRLETAKIEGEVVFRQTQDLDRFFEGQSTIKLLGTEQKSIDEKKIEDCVTKLREKQELAEFKDLVNSSLEVEADFSLSFSPNEIKNKEFLEYDKLDLQDEKMSKLQPRLSNSNPEFKQLLEKLNTDSKANFNLKLKLVDTKAGQEISDKDTSRFVLNITKINNVDGKSTQEILNPEPPKDTKPETKTTKPTKTTPKSQPTKTTPTPSPDSRQTCSGNFDAELLCRINNYRLDNNLKKLSMDGKLNQAANTHSVWMSRNQTLNHIGQDGKNPVQRCQDAGTSCKSENIARGSNISAEVVFNAWKNSPNHRQNLLGNYNRIGISIVGGYVTANFD
jgi:uncharacterized protein YkwD